MIKKKKIIKRTTNRKKSSAILALCVIAIMSFAYLGYFGLKTENYILKPFTKAVKRGLDLQGGIAVVEEIQAKKVTLDDMSREIEFLTMRVNKLGVSEIEVKQEGEKRIRIEIPGVFDAKGVMDTVGKTGELKFIGPDKKIILTGKDVKNAMAVTNQQNNRPEISLELNEEGRKKFAEATKKFLNQPISIYMDDKMLTSPTVNDVISTGNASISGSKSMEEAKTQADMIKSGALPLPIKPVSYKTVPATLGGTVLPNTKSAAIIGIVLVLIFMAGLYKIPGIIADIALVLFILLDLTAFIMIDATLTLAGIAGFLLTIGMAVDANVLIFERTKEELKAGKSVKSAVDAGFHRALSSILDSNITTIISAIVLYFVGTGSVRGFAVTLMIGILLSMFTALTVTKFLLKLALESGILSKPGHFGVKRREDHA